MVGVYYPYVSASGCVAVEGEQVEQSLLGGVHVGGDAAGAGAAAFGLVEQDGFLDAGEVGEQAAHAEVQAGVVRFAAHEVGDL